MKLLHQLLDLLVAFVCTVWETVILGGKEVEDDNKDFWN